MTTFATSLQGLLNDYLGRPKSRKARDPGYTTFRTFSRRHALTYKTTRDGYIEIEKGAAFPRGLITPHYSWGETLERLEFCLANPDAIGADGYYTE